jgi:hypothetical protein
VRFQTEVTIERPPAEVFHRLADEMDSTMPLVCPLTTSVRLDSDKPLAPGATGKISVRNAFVSRTVDFAVTRYQAPERLSLEMRHRDRSAQADYLFRERGTGTTVTLVTDAPPVGPRWLQGWNQRALERHERQDSHRLKALLEGRQTDPARAYWRSMARLLLIACALAALLGVAWASYRAITMGA